MMESTRILLCGSSGYMGQVVAESIAQRKDCVLAGGIDVAVKAGAAFPVFASPDDVDIDVDVVIDFSHPSLLTPLLQYAMKENLPIVLCATGYSDSQNAEIRKASSKIPIFKSGNMSLGMNLLIELVKRASLVLGTAFDVEIIEKHHRRKLDAPSGTALMIADALATTRPGEKASYVYDRHSRRMQRGEGEIGIYSVRGGTIVGEHEVLFAGPQEMLSITHTALSREIFAHGAVNAALFMVKQKAGLYDMSDLLSAIQ